MDLGSMRAFKKATGKDMWFTLISIMEVYLSNMNKSPLQLMKVLYETVDFETAAQLFYALAYQENKAIEIEQLEDGMLRVGWRPIEDEGNSIQPYPILLFLIASDIDEQIKEVVTGKKSLTGSDDQS
jgi:hypothetical protein